jgi:hypothetical protein
MLTLLKNECPQSPYSPASKNPCLPNGRFSAFA